MKQTTEEAAQQYVDEGKFKSDHPHDYQSFIDGAKWMEKQMFSREALILFAGYCSGKMMRGQVDVGLIFNQFIEDMGYDKNK